MVQVSGRFFSVWLAFCAIQVLVLPSVLVSSGATSPSTGETCEVPSTSPEDQYAQLAAQLKLMISDGSDSDEQSTVVLSSSRDSSQIRDQSYKTQKEYRRLDLSDLTRVLGYSAHHNSSSGSTIRVQAKGTMDQLVAHTLQQYHAIPAVVPEFKSITVAGAIVGGTL